MAVRSSTSEYQPIPRNYALKSVGKVGNNSPKMSVITSSSTAGEQKAGNIGAPSTGSTVRTLGGKTSF